MPISVFDLGSQPWLQLTLRAITSPCDHVTCHLPCHSHNSHINHVKLTSPPLRLPLPGSAPSTRFLPSYIINDCNINNHRAWLIFCNCSQNFINFPDWSDPPASTSSSFCSVGCASWPATPRSTAPASPGGMWQQQQQQLLRPHLTQIVRSLFLSLSVAAVAPPSCCQSSSGTFSFLPLQFLLLFRWRRINLDCTLPA